jgi:UDP-N-acetylglucosamine/UDP-N-acetylgalactosamine diphosphorylase
VAHVTLDGARIEPERPNAVKFETFLFDALPLAERTATVESERSEEFSPIKNASGADSPETARRDLNRLYGRWLSEAGVAVPCDVEGDPIVDIEIDPRLALDAEELAERLPPGLDIAGPTVLGPGGR